MVTLGQYRNGWFTQRNARQQESPPQSAVRGVVGARTQSRRSAAPTAACAPAS
eukprot:ctg_5027.g464